MLKPSQRDYFKDFISNTNIFGIDKIYRPTDPEFGLQKTMKMLVYAGIEKKVVGHYVTAVSSNHKRSRFNFGEIKTALAKYPGTNNIAYELVYADVIDTRDATSGSTRRVIDINAQNKIKVNQTQLEVTDDSTKLNVGGSAYSIFVQAGSVLPVSAVGTSLEIFARTGRLLIDVPRGELFVDMQNGPDLLIGSVEQVNGDPFRFRPKNSVIKVDSTLLKASMSNDELRYISNISNMRNNIKALGVSEGGLLPLWMKTAQGENVTAQGYTTAVPLCYCKPGTSESIALAVKNSGFDIKNINFEIDRYVVSGTEGNSADQYILFPNYEYNV